MYNQNVVDRVTELQEERLERRRVSPAPAPPDYESSGESADDYVQEKRVKKKKIRRHEAEEGRAVRKKRKRTQPPVEPKESTLTEEQSELLGSLAWLVTADRVNVN